MLVNLLLFFAAFGIVALVVGALPFSSFLFVVALVLLVGFFARVVSIAFIVSLTFVSPLVAVVSR